MDLEEALHTARALILADLTASDVSDADTVSLVEEAVAHRRWWVEQWPEGAPFVPGLVAQDVQDALLDRYGRWPLCPLCGDRGGPVAGPGAGVGTAAHEETGVDAGAGPHALDVEPELGEDPHWVCVKTATAVARVGNLKALGQFGAGGGV